MHGAERRDEERLAMLYAIADRMELPMAVLGFAWLGLLVLDLTRGLSPALQWTSTLIWLIFLAEFLLEFIIAPKKIAYLRSNWLTALALVVPALRIFRFLQVLRIMQGARVVRVLGSISRNMRALKASLGRHGFAYVVALTAIVTLAGAAGMYAFERPGLHSYPDALWWTAMIMATLGSGYWPHSVEGRILCVVLALYAFSVFGYVTATLATFLMGREARVAESDIAGTRDITALREEIAGLRDDVRRLADRE